MVVPLPCDFIHSLHAGEGNMKIYSPKGIIFPEATPEGNMILVGELIFIFHELACYKCFIIRCLRHLKTTSTTTWQRSLASDVFRVPLMFSCQRMITLSGKPARLPKRWDIFISRNMIFVLCDHVF